MFAALVKLNQFAMEEQATFPIFHLKYNNSKM